MRTKIFTSLFLIISLFPPGSIGAHEGTYPHTHYPVISAEYNNQIIYDELFRSKGTMTEATIQQFFVDKGSALATYKVPSDGSVPTMIGLDFTVESKNWSAAKVVYESAQWYDINPQVLLATLNKESSLVTSGTLDNLRAAMGYACPESDACNPFYYGFARQMDGAAYQFMHNFNGSESLNSNMVGIYYRGNTITLDGKSTYISNSATASLYRYTPHRPDSAQYYDSWGNIVTNHYYGNYNFIYYFNSWFPSWMNPPQLKYMSGTGFWDNTKSKFSATGDFNGDGKEGTASIYNYGNGKIGIWSFESNGTNMTPKSLYLGKSDSWEVTNTIMMVGGDINNDKKDDLIAMYHYGGGKIGIWGFISNGSSLTPRLLYMGKEGYWDITKSELFTAGDLNGDGYDDVASLYSYGNGKIGIWSFESNGTSVNPRIMYMGKAGAWDISKTKFFVGGDFDGNNKGDIAAVYDYGNERIGIWNFVSNGTSLFPVFTYLSNTGTWNFLKSSFFTGGDFNGDGKSDIAATYDYGNGRMAVWNFQLSGTSKDPKIMSDSSEDCWFLASTKWFVAANFDGGIKDELLAMYEYSNFRIGIWAFRY